MPIEDLLTPTEPNNTSTSSKSQVNKAHELKFNYQSFLSLLKVPESRNVVTTIRKFIEAYRGDYSVNLSVNEQVGRYKQYRDELAQDIQTHPVWIDAGEEAQLLGAEGIEYMTMNQIYAKAFCPVHSDDAEKDETITKKLHLFAWLEFKHLDVPESLKIDDEALVKAGQEFNRINEYSTPRDKLICLMNGVRILVRGTGEEMNADTLMPLLIISLVRAKPEKLYSNLQYISRFRNQAYLASGASYNLTTLTAAMSFIEKLDKSALVIEQEEYDKQLEEAVAKYNAESLERQEEEARRHAEEMSRREAEMIRADHAAHEAQRRESPAKMQRSSSTELKALLGDLEQNGTKLFQKVRQSSFMKQSKDIFSDFVSEAKTVVQSLVDDSDEETSESKAEAEALKKRQEQEEYELQLALAISLSEAEAANDKGKERVTEDEPSIHVKNVAQSGAADRTSPSLL